MHAFEVRSIITAIDYSLTSHIIFHDNSSLLLTLCFLSSIHMSSLDKLWIFGNDTLMAFFAEVDLACRGIFLTLILRIPLIHYPDLPAAW